MTTVAELLQVTGPDGRAKVRAASETLVKNAAGAPQRHNRKRGPLSVSAVPVIAVALSDALLRQFHETELADLVDGVWNDVSAVRTALERTRDSSSGQESVALSRHSLTVTTPIRVEVDHIELPALEPTLVIEFEIKSVVLTMDRGRLIGWKAAVFGASAELRLDQALLLPVARLEKEFDIGVVDIRSSGGVPAARTPSEPTDSGEPRRRERSM